MHGQTAPLGEIYYGSNAENIFVRVDGAGDASVGLEFENGPAEVKLAKGRIIEMETRRSGDRFRVTVARDGMPTARVPAEGWIEI
jgi:hypothetical protein